MSHEFSPDASAPEEAEESSGDRARAPAGPAPEQLDRDLPWKLFDAMPQLGWTARADGFIDHYNRGWYEYTGATPDAMQGWGWTSVHDPDLLPELMDRWRQAIRTGQPFEAIFRLKRHDGVFRWFLTRATPMHDEEGRVVRWVGVNTDIDAQRRAEEAAATSERRTALAARQHLEDTVRVRENLLAMVSHDLRNPLSAILMAATHIQLIGEKNEPADRVTKPATLILRAVDRMSRLVSDLLDLSQLEAGQPMPLHCRTLDVAALVRDAVGLLEPVAASKRLRLTATASTPCYARCDGERVPQVLSNLVGNAMKFTREGGSIDVACLVVDQEVVVSVRDTGTGIDEIDLPHIFDRYWRANRGRKGGAGLGLAIAKGHRGRPRRPHLGREHTGGRQRLPFHAPGHRAFDHARGSDGMSDAEDIRGGACMRSPLLR